jgi:hypothetical protein
MRTRIIIPYLKMRINNLENNMLRAYIIACLERLRVLNNRCWIDVELLEKMYANNTFDTDLIFKGSIQNKMIYDDLVNNTLVVFEHQETMFSYLTMTGGGEDYNNDTIKSWETVKLEFGDNSINDYTLNDRLSNKDDDMDIFFKSIIDKDTWKNGEVDFKHPSDFIEHLQICLMKYPVFVHGLFKKPQIATTTTPVAPKPKLNESSCKLLIDALGDISSTSRNSDYNTTAQVQAMMVLKQTTDPVVKYLIQKLCICTENASPLARQSVIPIELFRRMYDAGHLDNLIRVCTYPIRNTKIQVKQMDGLNPIFFRDRFSSQIAYHQELMDQDFNTIQKTRMFWKNSQ